jgi:outer membrane protein assembly factor BamB
MRIFAMVIISIAIFTQCNTKQEIAQWRGPERNGIYPDKNLLTQWPDSGPKLLWRYDKLGVGYASAAVTSSKVYTIGTIDSISYVFSFDLNGALLWKKELGKDWTKNWPGMRSTPIIYDGLGYVLSGFGIIFCFDANNGDILWTKDIIKEYKGGLLEFGQCENLLVDGDKIVCTPAGIDANVVALNRKTGDLIWKTPGTNDSTAYTNPIVIAWGGKKYFVNQTSKSLMAINIENGEVAWTYKLKGSPFANTPIFRNGFLYTVDAYKSGSFMLKISEDGKSVTEVWKNLKLDPQQGDLVLLGERMYGANERGKKFSCIDWNTGKEIYSDSTKAQIINVISAEDLLYCYELRGAFKLMKPTEKGFEKVGEFFVKGGSKLHCSHPVIKDGRLYVRHDSSLFVYNISK